MKKQFISKNRRKVLLISRRLAFALSCAILAAILCNSFITVKQQEKEYSYFVSPFEKKEAFESSVLFENLMGEALSDITRLAVIKSQIETNGSYNGQKIIDISAYANRHEELPLEAPTAGYYLDDLVKWGNYGYSYEKVYATEEELNCWFATDASSIYEIETYLGDWKAQSEQTRANLKQITTAGSDESLSIRMINSLPASVEEYERMAEELGLEYNSDNIVEMSILIPRYESAEGMDLAEYATDLNSYLTLRESLKTASKELFINFQEYSSYKNVYTLENSNIRYCYRVMVDGEICYITNLEGDFKEKKLEEITNQFSEYGKYFYYNADKSEMTTNMKIDSKQLRSELDNYQYAFGDNTRVWIGVDTQYPVADSLSEASDSFNKVVPNYWKVVAVALILLAISWWILAVLTRYEGRSACTDLSDTVSRERGYRIVLKRGDNIKTEPFFLLSVLILAAIAGLLGVGGYGLFVSEQLSSYSNWLPAGIGAGALLFDYAFTAFYLSFVRRAKVHTFWKNSCLYVILRFFKKAALSLYDNSSMLTRSLIPLLLLLVVNLILGGAGVIGIVLAGIVDLIAIYLLFQDKKNLSQVLEGTLRIGRGDIDYKIDTSRMHGENKELADAVNMVGNGIKSAVEQSMKDERLKADLITNVSHDIKTPLTSIINFVNLLKRENITDERVKGYINVLDVKSQRLKQLTDDLVEASKISSGNISLQFEKINFSELIHQTCGEFADKLKEKCLEVIISVPEGPVYIEADPRRIWRVVENLFSNAYKYALEGTRVYLDIRETEENGVRYALFSMKNISAQSLNIQADELTERFIRGDVSRSTEGSGLGLSIAKNLTELQKGRFMIYLDGDLFKVTLTFPLLSE